jgi:hypothetical protein
MSSGAVLCSRCVGTTSLSSGNQAIFSRNPLSLSRVINRRTLTSHKRQMSWWPFSKPDQFSTPVSTSSPPKSKPEQILAKDLQLVENQKRRDISRGEKQLLAWGESDPVVETIDPPFVDPLGHLPLSEHATYFAAPPHEYVETLEERAHVREEFERDMYLADPLANWRLCYPTRPDFGGTEIPRWQAWSEDKRMMVMEKYRRYDERFQEQIKACFARFDHPHYIADLRREVGGRIREEVLQQYKKRVAASAAEAKKGGAKKKGKWVKEANDGVTTESMENEDILDDPSFVVVDRKSRRALIKSRNDKLNELWFNHIKAVSIFEDLTPEGLTISEDKKKKHTTSWEMRKAAEEEHRKMMKVWTTMGPDAKVETVDWKAIHSEL